MSKFNSDNVQEEISITTNTQYLNEKALEKSKGYSEYAFILISSVFSSSIFIQFIRIIPNSFLIALQIPIILLTLFIAINMYLFVMNKVFSLKVYLLIGGIILGMVIAL
ncbi:MAG: hypothetical protein SWZ49_18735 [Cyanobacteriota bacterium]|nr:hypothetical protein [Cyanobacteriota bacterium]